MGSFVFNRILASTFIFVKLFFSALAYSLRGKYPISHVCARWILRKIWITCMCISSMDMKTPKAILIALGWNFVFAHTLVCSLSISYAHFSINSWMVFTTWCLFLYRSLFGSHTHTHTRMLECSYMAHIIRIYIVISVLFPLFLKYTPSHKHNKCTKYIYFINSLFCRYISSLRSVFDRKFSVSIH